MGFNDFCTVLWQQFGDVFVRLFIYYVDAVRSHELCKQMTTHAINQQIMTTLSGAKDRKCGRRDRGTTSKAPPMVTTTARPRVTPTAPARVTPTASPRGTPTAPTSTFEPSTDNPPKNRSELLVAEPLVISLAGDSGRMKQNNKNFGCDYSSRLLCSELDATVDS